MGCRQALQNTVGEWQNKYLNFCIVFFISPKKINKIIPYLNTYFKDRKILICREISKYYEEYLRSDLGNLKLFKNEPTII